MIIVDRVDLGYRKKHLKKKSLVLARTFHPENQLEGLARYVSQLLDKCQEKLYFRPRFKSTPIPLSIRLVLT